MSGSFRDFQSKKLFAVAVAAACLGFAAGAAPAEAAEGSCEREYFSGKKVKREMNAQGQCVEYSEDGSIATVDGVPVEFIAPELNPTQASSASSQDDGAIINQMITAAIADFPGRNWNAAKWLDPLFPGLVYTVSQMSIGMVGPVERVTAGADTLFTADLHGVLTLIPGAGRAPISIPVIYRMGNSTVDPSHFRPLEISFNPTYENVHAGLTGGGIWTLPHQMVWTQGTTPSNGTETVSYHWAWGDEISGQLIAHDRFGTNTKGPSGVGYLYTDRVTITQNGQTVEVYDETWSAVLVGIWGLNGYFKETVVRRETDGTFVSKEIISTYRIANLVSRVETKIHNAADQIVATRIDRFNTTANDGIPDGTLVSREVQDASGTTTDTYRVDGTVSKREVKGPDGRVRSVTDYYSDGVTPMHSVLTDYDVFGRVISTVDEQFDVNGATAGRETILFEHSDPGYYTKTVTVDTYEAVTDSSPVLRSTAQTTYWHHPITGDAVIETVAVTYNEFGAMADRTTRNGQGGVKKYEAFHPNGNPAHLQDFNDAGQAILTQMWDEDGTLRQRLTANENGVIVLDEAFFPYDFGGGNPQQIVRYNDAGIMTMRENWNYWGQEEQTVIYDGILHPNGQPRMIGLIVYQFGNLSHRAYWNAAGLITYNEWHYGGGNSVEQYWYDDQGRVVQTTSGSGGEFGIANITVNTAYAANGTVAQTISITQTHPNGSGNGVPTHRIEIEERDPVTGLMGRLTINHVYSYEDPDTITQTLVHYTPPGTWQMKRIYNLGGTGYVDWYQIYSAYKSPSFTPQFELPVDPNALRSEETYDDEGRLTLRAVYHVASGRLVQQESYVWNSDVQSRDMAHWDASSQMDRSEHSSIRIEGDVTTDTQVVWVRNASLDSTTSVTDGLGSINTVVHQSYGPAGELTDGSITTVQNRYVPDLNDTFSLDLTRILQGGILLSATGNITLGPVSYAIEYTIVDGLITGLSINGEDVEATLEVNDILTGEGLAVEIAARRAPAPEAAAPWLAASLEVLDSKTAAVAEQQEQSAAASATRLIKDKPSAGALQEI